MNILVIDVGTSSMRGILFRADGKKLKQHQVAYRPSYNTKGELEQSADEFVNVLATIVKSIQACLLYTSSDPDAIWAWGMIGAYFICQEGECKIWHFHYFRYIKCLYKKG